MLREPRFKVKQGAIAMVEMALVGSADHLALLALARAFHAEDGHRLDAGGEAAIAALAAGTPHAKAWLIRERDRTVGYVVLALGFSVEHGGCDSFLDDFYIEPGHRGRGLGSAVLTALEREARALSVKAIHLEVMPGNDRAEALYRRFGFAPSGRALLSKRLS